MSRPPTLYAWNSLKHTRTFRSLIRLLAFNRIIKG